MLVVGGLTYIAGLLLAATSSNATDLYVSVGLLIGLGLSGTSYAVVLGAVGRAVSSEKSYNFV